MGWGNANLNPTTAPVIPTVQGMKVEARSTGAEENAPHNDRNVATSSNQIAMSRRELFHTEDHCRTCWDNGKEDYKHKWYNCEDSRKKAETAAIKKGKGKGKGPEANQNAN